MTQGRRGLGLRGQILLLVLVILAVGTALVLLIYQPGPKTLSEAATKGLLRELPYRFEFHPAPAPDGASGAVAGTARGAHEAVVHFGVSLGRGGDPVSLSPRSDLADATGGETFRVTSDVTVVIDGKSKSNPEIKTKAQWREAIAITASIEDKLCQATEGKHCAI
jgi:hypothetical protein